MDRSLSPTDGQSERRPPSLGWFLTVALLLTVWVFHTAGRAGFCPADEGFVLAQARRLWNGQVPHRDFITPRPAGSAVLHLIDFLIPLPLLEASRLISLLEIVLYSTVLAALVLRRGPQRWSIVEIIAWAASVLVNLHGFPLMAWYTIDGILLVALGIATVDRGVLRSKRWLVVLGFVLLGAAPLTKQSFFAAPLLGVLRVLWGSPGAGMRARLQTIVLATVIGTFPGLLYVGIVAAAGGSQDMLAQLLGAAPVLGAPLLVPLLAPLRQPLLELAALLIALTASDLVAERVSARRDLATTFSLVLRAVATYAILALPLRAELGWAIPGNLWGARLFWALALIVLWRSVVERRLAGAGLALLVLGWMTTLSWGYANPNLVGGSIALGALCLLWRGAPLLAGGLAGVARPAAALGALLAAAWTVHAFTIARSRPYYDGPPSATTVALGPIVPAFGAVRSNGSTAQFIAEIVACIQRYPARRVAILPDNAWVYPALGLDNPLPVDWFYPPEYGGHDQQVLDSAARLRREGDFLVLFQTVSAFDLFRTDTLVPATPTSPIAFYFRAGFAQRIADALGGTKITCGSMAGRWSPAGSVSAGPRALEDKRKQVYEAR